MAASRALLVPVPDYGPDAPLFWYMGQLLRSLGWTVDTAPFTDARTLESVSLVVAFGEGCELAVEAAALEVAGVWLSPPLTEPSVAAALATNPAPTLVVGSLVDPTWDRMVAVRLRRAEVFQITGADRRLQVVDDPFRSIEIVERILERFAALVHRLG
jgi:hypothetical protein